MNEDKQIQTWIDRIDTELVRYFSKKDLSANPLDRAMEYTVLAGGKRLRPLLTLIACEAFGGSAEAALPLSLASELLHAYSLIHDDLPCMDDDAMRRGKPTNHIIFGEANAILAGDALQTEAFAILATASYPELSAEKRVAIIAEFAEAVGRKGMIAGQVMDLEHEGKTVALEQLLSLHRRKTGSLLRFAVRLGGHLAGADPSAMNGLTTYAESIGLLFQVVDDLLDTESTSETLGKTAGKDQDNNKATFPKLLGAGPAHEYADKLVQEAIDALNELPTKTQRLANIARYIREREY